MSEWKTYKLGDIITLNYGKSLITEVREKGNIPVFSSSGISGWHNEALVNNKAIIIGRKGNVGSVYYTDVPFYCIDTAYYILPNQERYDLKFLYYKLKSMNLIRLTSDSAVPGLNRETAYVQEIDIPNIETQKEIARILSSLDDKIELNLQMNQTLEAMAQAVFKEWFVNFNFPNFDGELVDGLPKGWRECSMRDFGKIICGKTPSKTVDEYFGGEYMFIKIPDMHNSVFIIETTDSLTELGLNSQSNKTIPPNSICISSIATVGLVCINPKSCQTNQQINTIVPKNNYLKYYIYFLAISMKETFLATASGGTATLNMNTSQFSNLNAIMPNDDILKEFDEVVSPMMAKILENNYCIQALTQTRDALLPKLMCGKIKVKA